MDKKLAELAGKLLHISEKLSELSDEFLDYMQEKQLDEHEIAREAFLIAALDDKRTFEDG